MVNGTFRSFVNILGPQRQAPSFGKVFSSIETLETSEKKGLLGHANKLPLKQNPHKGVQFLADGTDGSTSEFAK